jgi:hypothetical protein
MIKSPSHKPPKERTFPWPNSILIFAIILGIVLSCSSALTIIQSQLGEPRYPNSTAIQECERPFIEFSREPYYYWTGRISATSYACFTTTDTREQIDQWYQQQPGWGYTPKDAGSMIVITSYENRFFSVVFSKHAVATTNRSKNGLTKIIISATLWLSFYLR